MRLTQKSRAQCFEYSQTFFAGSLDERCDFGKSNGTVYRPCAARNFLLKLGNADIPLGLIIVERHTEIMGEKHEVFLVSSKPFEQT